MLSSIIGFYIAQSLQPILPMNPSTEIPVMESTRFEINKLDFTNFLSVNPMPTKKTEFIAPVINSAAAISIDEKTGAVLYEKNAHQSRQIASLTKLMTAVIILEENDPTSIVTIPKTANYQDGSQMFLRTGEQITVENLLYGLMINSANDAAMALAEFNAGSTEKFVEKMNKKAEELNLKETHFQNPIGLDHRHNYSSAYDMANLARYVYQKDFIQKVAIIKEMEVKSTDEKTVHKLKSTNNLLDSYLKIKGLKTGTTDQAGQCLAAIASNDNNNEIITVVLGSPARFTESKVLIDWTFRAYTW